MSSKSTDLSSLDRAFSRVTLRKVHFDIKPVSEPWVDLFSAPLQEPKMPSKAPKKPPPTLDTKNT